LARAIYSGKNVVILDDILSGLDADTEEHVFKSLFSRTGLFRRMGTTVLLATHAVHRLSYADHIVALKSDGSISEQGTLSELKTNGGYLALLKTQYKDHEKDLPNPQGQKSPKIVNNDPNQESHIGAMEGKLSRQNGDVGLYLYYFGSVHWASSAFWMTFFILEGMSPKLSELLVIIWMSSLENQGSTVNSFYLGVYTSVSAMAALALVIGAHHLLMFFAPRSAETLHQRLLNSVIHAPLSFFTSVDTGTTMNR
jgi:ATP-binding cassette subfamily C (CFTR/MRP) protein 1